jgi:hypothetical protein
VDLTVNCLLRVCSWRAAARKITGTGMPMPFLTVPLLTRRGLLRYTVQFQCHAVPFVVITIVDFGLDRLALVSNCSREMFSACKIRIVSCSFHVKLGLSQLATVCLRP